MHCEKDEHGACKTHRPGTQAEADDCNRVIAGAQQAIEEAGVVVLSMGIAIQNQSKMVDRENARLRAAGSQQQIRNVEAQIVEILYPLAEAIKTAQEAVVALRVVATEPSASAN